MLSRAKKFTYLTIFVQVAVSLASEPVELSKHQVEPKYLVPISPNGRHRAAAIQGLLGNRWGNGTMISTDTPGGDFAVSAWSKPPLGEHEEDSENFITYLKLGPNRSIETEIDVPIDPELGIAIQRAWATMLLRARYPKNEYRGADGSNVEFSVWITGLGGVYGQAWSPSKGLVKELSDIGWALADFCKTSAGDRSFQRKKLLLWLQDFARRANST